MAAPYTNHMTLLWLAVVVASLLVASTGRGEIYEWRDGSGARHFTNQRDLVPEPHQGSAQIVVRARPQPQGDLEPIVEEAPPVPRSDGGGAQVVSSRSLEQAYESGVRDALAAAERGNEVVGGNVQIVGPLAVAHSEAAGAAPFYDPYYPFVTTSFDRGRSRHQTLRMLLQDQFQLDRDGPFVYQRMRPTGLGPNLSPFLRRGLSRGFVRSRVRTR